tara:strand:+ start:316 stop:735 length:420 start_codon:yes stop_codon:yes gene_type:complete
MRVYAIELTKDDDSWLVTCPALPEVTSFGDTEEDARTHAADAIEEALAARIATGRDIPLPSVTNKGPNVVVPLQTQMKVELYQAMREDGKSRADLQRAMKTHRPQVDRLFDLNHASKLSQLEAAFRALGRDVDIAVKAA